MAIPWLMIRLFLIIFFLGITHLLPAQIYTGSINLDTQTKVDSFPLTYPGIKRINGNLIIGSADTLQPSNIVRLDSLHQLVAANNIYISNNGILENLHGLEGIDTTATLLLYNNPALENLHGLHHIRVCDVLIIRKNNQLQQLQGLGGLQFANGIMIEHCQNLLGLYGLDSLRSTFFGFNIRYNPRLKSLNGLLQIEQCQFNIDHNDSLLQLGSFPKLNNAGFVIQSNALLANLGELDNPAPDTLLLRLIDNPSLLSLWPVRKADWFSLFTENNAQLSHITMDSIGVATLSVSGPAIQHIQLSEVGDINNFEVFNCPRLRTLENVMPIIDSIYYSYAVHDNDSLEVISEASGPHFIRHLLVNNNPKLAQIRGFETLESVFAQTPTNTCFDCGIHLRSPQIGVVDGFNRLKYGKIFISDDAPQGIFHEIRGFNAADAVFDEVILNGFPPQKIVAFNGAQRVINQLQLTGVLDTFSVFQQLQTAGPSFTGAGIRISTAAGCYNDPASFAPLEYLEGIPLDNGSTEGWPLAFPALHHSDKLIHTWSNPVCTSFYGIYPALRQAHTLLIENCKQLHSLDGLEGIAEFRQTTAPFGPKLGATGCDSLSDCSAVCWLLDHAVFIPASSGKIYLDNPLYPCNDAASVVQWCDALSLPVWTEPVATTIPLTVFPNPVQSQLLHFETNPDTAIGIHQFKVGDARGAIVMTGNVTFNLGKAVLNVGALPAGWYSFTAVQQDNTPLHAVFIKS